MAGKCKDKRLHPKEYYAWLNMKARCNNFNNPAYKNYGGRGITYTASWETFPIFLADMGVCPNAELTLERVDNSRGYNKLNCYWATRTEQAYNRRTFVTNSSGTPGVSYHSTRQLWIAQHGRKQIYAGPSFEAAVTARKAQEFASVKTLFLGELSCPVA